MATSLSDLGILGFPREKKEYFPHSIEVSHPTTTITPKISEFHKEQDTNGFPVKNLSDIEKAILFFMNNDSAFTDKVLKEIAELDKNEYYTTLAKKVTYDAHLLIYRINDQDHEYLMSIDEHNLVSREQTVAKYIDGEMLRSSIHFHIQPFHFGETFHFNLMNLLRGFKDFDLQQISSSDDFQALLSEKGDTHSIELGIQFKNVQMERYKEHHVYGRVFDEDIPSIDLTLRCLNYEYEPRSSSDINYLLSAYRSKNILRHAEECLTEELEDLIR